MQILPGRKISWNHLNFFANLEFALNKWDCLEIWFLYLPKVIGTQAYKEPPLNGRWLQVLLHNTDSSYNTGFVLVND